MKVFASAGLVGAVLMAVGVSAEPRGGTFGQDVAFLKKHTAVVVLGKGDSRVAVAPAYQGRVMTSTLGGEDGPSFGWLNYKVIEEGVLPPEKRQGRLEDHLFVFGGEERFWLGPEGGQYALFFAPGAAFDFNAWHTPALIDTEPFELVKSTETAAEFRRDFALTNYSGTRFVGRIERQVRVLDAGEAGKALGIKKDGKTRVVAYETDNRITNRGPEPWTKEKGLLSIWLLGMYKPSPLTTVVIPFKKGPEAKLGPKVNDAYFGKVPADYIVVKDDVLFFKGDGTRRGKIGISPARSKGLAGSYDAAGKVLTIISYNIPKKHAGYVNSMWEQQQDPYSGDALNSYNDGSPEPGKPPLGPFYEVETSSPAAALAAGESLRHVQRTVHISGPEVELDRIVKSKFGVSLFDIKNSLATKMAH